MGVGTGVVLLFLTRLTLFMRNRISDCFGTRLPSLFAHAHDTKASAFMRYQPVSPSQPPRQPKLWVVGRGRRAGAERKRMWTRIGESRKKIRTRANQKTHPRIKNGSLSEDKLPLRLYWDHLSPKSPVIACLASGFRAKCLNGWSVFHVSACASIASVPNQHTGPVT